ncbi:MAG: AmmeMemoRadiSam system protein B [Bacteroidetes bacterium]|nr:AmmeMemoRadiSam system protein B [Bacteroidota bacterium]
MKKRTPAVEGRFYPSSKTRILDQIEKIDEEARYPHDTMELRRIFGAVLPHAGHLYSGHQTVPYFKLLQQQKVLPDTFIIVHPNHSGTGASIAIDDSDTWVNAIGEVPVNLEFAAEMNLPFNHTAHSGEHSAEVIVPFIQYFMPDHSFNIVAVCMRDQSHESARRISQGIQKAAKKTGLEVMVLASCDFSHFLDPGTGRKRDQFVLDEILSRNTLGVERAVREHHLSICGYGPIMALMDYSMSFDPDYRIRVLARGHSGEVIPSAEVVDYISMILYQ